MSSVRFILTTYLYESGNAVAGRYTVCHQCIYRYMVHVSAHRTTVAKTKHAVRTYVFNRTYKSGMCEKVGAHGAEIRYRKMLPFCVF